MSIDQHIQQLLQDEFQPSILELINESHKHIGHQPLPDHEHSHYKVKIVSQKFEGLSRVQRHQMVYACLASLMNNNPIHALSIEALTTTY